MAKSQPVRAPYNKKAYATLKNDPTKQVVEVAEIGVLTLDPSQAGQKVELTVSSAPEMIHIDKTFKNDKEGRVLIIAASGRNASGQKFSFSMSAEQADRLKENTQVTCIAVLDNTGTKARLNLMNAE